MDENSLIRVLHYRNPHLMWVEVKNNHTCTLRQVGLFGVVPRQTSLVDGERVSIRSDRWEPQANGIVEEFLESKHQLYFKSTYRLDDDVDPTSIFSNQPHIFGEISSVRKKDCTRKQLVDCLNSSLYAYKSKNEFWQMLEEGKIKTKLQENEKTDILQKIMEYYQAKGSWHRKKEMFYKHLSPSQVSTITESAPKLTTENLEKHHILTLKQNIDTDKLDAISKQARQRKYQDFNCDVEAPVQFVEDVIKRFTVVENKRINENTITDSNKNYVNYVKNDNKNDNKNDTVRKAIKKVKIPSVAGSVVSNVMVYDEEINSQDSEDEIPINASKRITSQKAIGRANVRLHTRHTRDETTNKFEELMKLKDKFRRTDKKGKQSSETDITHIKKSTEEGQTHKSNSTMAHKENNKKKEDKEMNHSQENEETSSNASPGEFEERLVAYGPPTSNLQSLVRKIVMVKLDDAPTKQVEDTDVTWKGGNIEWEDDCQANFDKTEADQNELTNSDIADRITSKCKNVDKNSRSIEKYSLVSEVTADTDVNDSKNNNSDKNNDLNEPRNYNNLVQSKQDYTELGKLKVRGARHNSITEKQNDKHDFSTSSENYDDNNKKNKTPAHKSMSKLLEIMRRRSPKYNDSLSSTDDNSVKKDSNLDSSLSTDDSAVQKQNAHNGTPTTKSNQDSDEDLELIHAKLNPKPLTIKTKPKHVMAEVKKEINVNPYKNLDGSKSVFVDNLVQPLLLAHTKNNNQVLPQSSLRDIPFKLEIHNTLRNKQVKSPTRLQSVSWPYILRGHSLFMISAAGSGKTVGYLPAVCNLVLDYNFDFTGLGPICIIVCATALSVAEVARECRLFLNHQRVVAGFPGVDNTKLITDLVNGCDVLVSTPSLLYKLLRAEIGVDLRRLTTVVLDDCERLGQVYELEVKAIQLYVKQMLKSRTDKQVKVQYVLASRKWCDFMSPLAKKAPDTIVTFAAFHECVLYSKASTSVSFVKKNNKIDAVVEFLKETDDSKLTVIICRSNDEVDLLESTLKSLRIAVVACNNKMTIHNLYKIRTDEFCSVLICCDGNLNHLNVNNASYLVHFSMPAIYSQFCARFAVLNENYPSMFGSGSENVKIKILLEETNVEQLPKILNFVKRCSSQVPEVLNEVAQKVLEQKDLAKAERLVPICNSMLSLGECADLYTCQERHAILERFDVPKPWMPCVGVITFKIIHYNSAISYSARLLTNTTNHGKKKYPETYGTLCMKLGMFFSKEDNKRLHGEPKVGDICAVAVRKNFIARCQVLKINNYEKDQAKFVVINLIDEEQITVVRAVELYFLPEEYKTVQTYVVKVHLANIRPQDKDVTFSELAMNKLKKITDDDDQLYLKGRVIMTIGNIIFVANLEACVELSALGETVVKYDFKNLLLDTHAIPNPEHLSKLQKICDIGNLKVRHEPEIKTKPRTVKKETEHRWAHLDKNDWSDVIFSNTINAGKFFVRRQKFSKCINSLISDIKKHVAENSEQIENVCVNDVILAEFPDDLVYERAMIEEIIDESKVRCFFVDNADWREVAVNKLKPIPQKFIKQIPFQSIECRLIGLKPPGEEWTEFSTNWLHDNCLEDEKGCSKRMYVKYLTKEKAELTGGHKYGVILVDTTTEEDVVINKRMTELNLAAVDEAEVAYLETPLDFVREKTDTSSYEDFDELEVDTKATEVKNYDECRSNKDLIPIPINLIPNQNINDNWDTNDVLEEAEINDSHITPYISEKNELSDEVPRASLKNIFADKPIKSYPLVSDSDEDSDKWDVCIDEDLGKCFGMPELVQSYNKNEAKQVDPNVFFAAPAKRDNVKLFAIDDAKNKRDNNKLNVTGKKPDVYVKDVGISHFNDDNKSQVEHSFKTITEDTVNNKQKDKTAPKRNMLHSKDNLKINNMPERTVNDTNYVQSITINKKALTEVIDIRRNEPTKDLDILRGEIKDISLYDSDDTLSISTTNDKTEDSVREHTKSLLYKKETSVLDSDDTQSILTENEKEVSIEELKEPNKSLDSDDSEFEVIARPVSVISPVVEIGKKTHNMLDNSKASNNNENININHSKVAEMTGSMKVDEAPAAFKGKMITITEIAKPETTMTLAKNHEVTKFTEQSKTDDVDPKTNKKFERENHKGVIIVEGATELKGKTITITETAEPIRTPQLVWRQNKHTITVKIKVVVDEYTIETGDRYIKFAAYQNEIKYAFQIELYGVIDHNKTVHSNKGQYILVTMTVMLKKSTKWLKLTKDFNNWIVYDVDSIDTSSDEETPVNDDALKVIMDQHEKSMDFDDYDNDFDDTSGYL